MTLAPEGVDECSGSVVEHRGKLQDDLFRDHGFVLERQATHGESVTNVVERSGPKVDNARMRVVGVEEIDPAFHDELRDRVDLVTPQAVLGSFRQPERLDFFHVLWEYHFICLPSHLGKRLLHTSVGGAFGNAMSLSYVFYGMCFAVDDAVPHQNDAELSFVQCTEQLADHRFASEPFVLFARNVAYA